MEIEEFMERISQIKGVSEVRRYTLVNNYGVSFRKGGYTFDARFMANCYGAELNYWVLFACDKFYKDGYKLYDKTKSAYDVAELIPTIESL